MKRIVPPGDVTTNLATVLPSLCLAMFLPVADSGGLCNSGVLLSEFGTHQVRHKVFRRYDCLSLEAFVRSYRLFSICSSPGCANFQMARGDGMRKKMSGLSFGRHEGPRPLSPWAPLRRMLSCCSSPISWAFVIFD